MKTISLRPMNPEYGRLRVPSRLSAALRPLRGANAALTAVLAGQHLSYRTKGKKKTGNNAYTKSRTLATELSAYFLEDLLLPVQQR